MKNLTSWPYMTKTTARSRRVNLNTFSRSGADIKQSLRAHGDAEEKQEPSAKAIEPQTSGAPAKLLNVWRKRSREEHNDKITAVSWHLVIFML